MRRYTGSAHGGARTSIDPCGSRSFSRTSSGCDRPASPIHDGATTSVRAIYATRPGRIGSVPGGDEIADELVQSPAIGAARFARGLDGEIDARMGVPELLRGKGAMKREVRRGDLHALLVKL